MSVQFGRWNQKREQVASEYLERVKSVIAPYGPDKAGIYRHADVGILFYSLQTTRESRDEFQPYVSPSGVVFTWDGRLDNRDELITDLGDAVTKRSTDVEIAAAAHEKWGSRCFARFIGDWALAAWEAKQPYLILARDFVGVRHLYYSIRPNHIVWSTILDPLVLLAEENFSLNEEYVAGWLSYFPGSHLTPYVGIYSVPPCSYVVLRDQNRTITKYWDFDSNRTVRYRTDAEYEDHFRVLFRESVRRRLRSDTPILAELSGGMDSSSIVCMADSIMASGSAETPSLNTLSYYDDSEPRWNERPYFRKVEQQRGRTGCHVNKGDGGFVGFEILSESFAPTPRLEAHSRVLKQCADYIRSGGNRVLLSGLGGDEVMGGFPNPIPLLSDLLVTGSLRTLASQLKTWALNKRKPWVHLFFETLRGFLPLVMVSTPKERQPAPWLDPQFVKRNREALKGYGRRLRFFGPPPTFQENLSTLEALRRRLSWSILSHDPPFERSYPFLDRTLLEFLYALPPEQLLRPGQRRSLMRRSLAGIVPDEILNRQSKAIIARAPRTALGAEWNLLADLSHGMMSAGLGVVVENRFQDALQLARQGQEVRMISLMRTVALEEWLRHLGSRSLIKDFALPNGLCGKRVDRCLAQAEQNGP